MYKTRWSRSAERDDEVDLDRAASATITQGTSTGRERTRAYVVGLALHLDLRVAGLMERGVAVRVVAVGTRAVATVVVAEASRDAERVRGDQAEVGRRATASARRVDERGLNEQAVLSVEAAVTC